MSGATVSRQADPAPNRLWERVGRQLRHPTGFGGRVAGALMARVNAVPNRAAIDFLEVAPDDDVLEIGFGPGEGVARLAELAPMGRVCGIDASHEMFAAAARRNRAAIARRHVRLVEGYFRALPWRAGAFSKVLAVNVAYFFGDDARELSEIHRVLRPGGGVAIYATSAATMRRWPFAGGETHRHLDEMTLRSMLSRGGFASADIEINQVRLAMGVSGLVARAKRGVSPTS